MIYNNILETIGNTPLIKLNNVTKGIDATILVKVEYFNPGNSVKDRMALRMVEDAEKSGQLKPGGTIIECTSGNTGMGLALVASIKGYKCIFTMNDKQSQLKIDALRALGAEVIVCPTAVEPDDPRSFYSVARKKHEQIPNSFFPNQYDNPSNWKAHYESTGPEIWKQTEGKVTHLVGGAGTGGTLSGTSRYLTEQNPNFKTIGVDPYGSILKKYKETGVFDENEIYPFLVEGIGEDMLPENVHFDYIEEFVQVTDKESALMARKLARTEGLFVGWSAGTAVHGAIKYAKKHLTKDDVMVVMLADHGSRYLNKIYNDNWMAEHGFSDDSSLLNITDIFSMRDSNKRNLITVSANDRVGEALTLFGDKFISQVPVVQEDKFVGSINDQKILRAMLHNKSIEDMLIKEIMDEPFTFVSQYENIEVIATMFKDGHKALLTRDENEQVHIITPADVIGVLGKG